ncbi:220 kDa polyprotein [Faustovirus ST1]|nr:220 kDa polyprotein [Faustovirus ST1]
MVYDAGMDAYDANLVSGPRSYLRVAHSGNDPLLPSGDYYQYLGKRYTVPAGGIGINQVGTFGQLADADKDHVLFTSLSVILKNIATSRVAGNTFYTTDNLGEVTAYMKEKYRAFAPYFKCLFKAMIDKCLMMKKVISEKKLNLGKFPVVGIQNPWPGKLPAYEQDSERHRDRLLGVLDAVINGSNDFIKSCDVLAREVGDDAKYLELYNNAIKDYKTQNGFDPLMPLSSSLYFLKDATPAHADELLPVGNFGEDGFKFLYGARLLLHPYDIKISGENLVGFNDLVSVYNMTIDGKMALPADLVGKFSENFAKATRFLFGAKYIRGMETMNVMRPDEDYRNITVGGAYAANALVNNAAGILRTKFVDDSAHPISNRADYSIVVAGNRPAIALDDGGVAVNVPAYAANKLPACVYSIAKDLALVLRLTESNSRDDRVKDIVDYLVAFVDSPNTRLDIQNIVDLNLIPINIHALARDIPLAFLYNYAYTFDRLAVDNFYPGSARAAKVIKNLCADNLGGDRVVIDSAKDAFLSSLINPDYNPFADGSVDVYENYIKPMMVGATGNDLGRPKFISDELFGKVLFGEIYKTGQYSEIGPQASYSGVNKAATAVKILNDALTILLGAGGAGVCLFAYAGANANGKINRRTAIGADDNLRARAIRDISELIMNNKPTTFKKAFTLVKSLLPQPNAANAADVTNSKMAATEIAILSMILYPIIINQINNLPMDYTAQNLPQLADATRMINNYYVGFDETQVDGLQGADRDAKVAIFNAGVVSPVTTKVANAALPGDVSDLPSALAGNRVPAGYNGVTGINIAQSHVASSGHGYSINLHYLKNGERKTKDNEVDVDATQVGVVRLANGEPAGKELYTAGRARYNTTIVRQLLFITNLYRLVRLRLQRDLVYSKEVIMRSVPITRNEITELNGNSLNRQNAYENYKNDPRYRYYLVVKRNP